MTLILTVFMRNTNDGCEQQAGVGQGQTGCHYVSMYIDMLLDVVVHCGVTMLTGAPPTCTFCALSYF